MKKTIIAILLCTLALMMIFSGCNQQANNQPVEEFIKKTEIRVDDNTLTVVYADGYERSYSLTQPIEAVDQKEGACSARAIGSAAQIYQFVSGTQAGQISGGIVMSTEFYTANENVIYTNIGSLNTFVIDGTMSALQFQATAAVSYFEHEGKKYENCNADLLELFRQKTTLIDFSMGYEENPFAEIVAKGFNKFENLEAIVLPASIKTVGQNAFEGCTKLNTVYFGGSEQEWQTVVLVGTESKEEKETEGEGTMQENLLASCTVYFYSEEEPTTPGSYWHYVDGKPVAW